MTNGGLSAHQHAIVQEVERARRALDDHREGESEAREALATALREAREAGIPMAVLIPASGYKRAMIHRAATSTP